MLVTFAGACTSGDDGDEGRDRREPARAGFLAGTDPYLVASEPPSGFVLESIDVGGDEPGRLQFPRGQIGVFRDEQGAVVVAERVFGEPWSSEDRPAPLPFTSPDGREIRPNTYEEGALVVSVGDVTLWVRAEPRGAHPELVEELAVAIDPQLGSRTEHLERVALLPSGWSSADGAVTMVFGHGQDDRVVTTRSVTSAEGDAIRELLTDDPTVDFVTESSVYDLERYPRPTKVRVEGRTAWFGMLGAGLSALVVEGEPGAVLVTPAGSADWARDNRELLGTVASSLERVGREELAARARAVDDRRLDEERARMVSGREVVWEEVGDDGRLRLLVIDPTPRYFGPDTGATRNAPAPCLVVLVREPSVRAFDGCAPPEPDPHVSVGEVSATGYPVSPLREVFALATDEVAAVELRWQDEVVAEATLVELDEEVDGRRRLFIARYAQRQTNEQPRLRLVALDADGTVLREVDHGLFQTFAARPNDPR